MSKAQELFNLIQSGTPAGLALKAKVNRAAAEASGWRDVTLGEVCDSAYWRCVGLGKQIGKAPDRDYLQELPDYCASLTDAAGLPKVQARTRVANVSDAGGYEAQINHAGDLDASIWYTDHTPAREACARTVCWYVATGGAE